VGELYRRKLLPEKTLNTVFSSLLGMSEENYKVDDLVIEGAINLMNKVGQVFEDNAKKQAEEKKKDESIKNFNRIFNRFDELQNMPEETVISNRIKLLIKNMFTNKENKWQKTKDINESGPKTKKQVQREVEEKHLKE